MPKIQTVFPLDYEQLPFFTRKIVLESDDFTCQVCKVKLVGKILGIKLR